MQKEDIKILVKNLIEFNYIYDFSKKENENMKLHLLLKNENKCIILKKLTKYIKKLSNDIFMRSYIFIDKNFKENISNLDDSLLNYCKNELKTKLDELIKKEEISKVNYLSNNRLELLYLGVKPKEINFKNIKMTEDDLDDFYYFYLLFSYQYIKIVRDFSKYNKDYIKNNLFEKEDLIYTYKKEHLISFLRENNG